MSNGAAGPSSSRDPCFDAEDAAMKQAFAVSLSESKNASAEQSRLSLPPNQTPIQDLTPADWKRQFPLRKCSGVNVEVCG